MNLLQSLQASGVGKFFIASRHEFKELWDPLWMGFIVAVLLFILDSWVPVLKGEGRAADFVESSLKHIEAPILLLGFCLFAVSAFLTGWPAGGLLRKWVVMPVLRLSHEVLLVAAGGILAVVLWTAVQHRGFEMRMLSALWTCFILVVGGAEMQGGLWYCRRSEAEVRAMLPVPLHIILGGIGTLICGPALVASLRH